MSTISLLYTAHHLSAISVVGSKSSCSHPPPSIVRLTILVIKCPDPYSCVSISVHLRSGCWSWWRSRNTCAQVTHALSRMVQTRGLKHQKSAARAAIFPLCSITRSTIYTTHTLEIIQSLVCPLFVYLGSTQNMFCLWVTHKQQHQCCPG